MDCIFCKIVNGEIPSSKIYENKDVLAFLDLSPVNKGHTLVIPKQHYETIMDIPDEILKEVIVAAKKVSKSLMKSVNAGGVTVSMSNYEIAGQVVPHAHFHVIPRHKGDGLKLWPQGKYSDKEMELFAEKIRKAL